MTNAAGISKAATTEAATTETATAEAATAEAATAEAATAEAATAEAATAEATSMESESTEAESTEAATTETASANRAIETASAESESAGERRKTAEPGGTDASRTGAPWWSSVRAVAALAIAALIAAVTFGMLWATEDSEDRLAALQARLDTEAAAETAASQYALRVSEVDFHDLDAWRDALTDGVSEQLAPKLDAAVDVVGPWLSEMEYTATARLLAADIAEDDGDRFVVQVFVDMTSKSKQTPDGVAATATYTVTMDRASNWTITDVGGVGAGLPAAGGR